MIRSVTISFLLLLTVNSAGQEVLSGLLSNPLIGKNEFHGPGLKSSSLADTIALPLFDDFSGSSVITDTSFWSDKSVFVNNTWSTNQISMGMATFDALDSTGSLYPGLPGISFEADRLTSRYIDLNYPVGDSIYLSFHYQPQGLGDQPEPNDSLTLQFWSPTEAKWYSVWRVAGSPSHEFRSVIIPILDNRFLTKGFRFRFTNYVTFSANTGDPSLIGNCDHWNLDYIKLARNRTYEDTLYKDVAFTRPVRSLLKTHEAMPWPHFKKVFLFEMGSSITIFYRNNDQIIRNITRDFVIRDLYKNIDVHSFSAGAVNVNPSTNETYFALPFYTYNTDNPDSALFLITASIKTDPFDPKKNDTIRYTQRFGNYFAFDDGSMEMGYGINGQGSRNAMVAYRFKAFTPDSLRAIRIAFNESINESNYRAFDLMVWDDDQGKPGNLLYSMEEVMVNQGPGINGFQQYILNTPVAVNDIFYIGWKQRSETFLNAGVDINSLQAGRHFYWLNGSWNASQIAGALMIRAVTGPSLTVVSSEDPPLSSSSTLKIWPNPARSNLNMETAEGQIDILSIYDTSGRLVLTTENISEINISHLNPGLYIVIAYTRTGLRVSGKFIKAN